jgi:peptidoglycan/LPS O-acetylase OafA/YrhL
MERFGPQYCETPATITGIFPVEPANAISSGVIVLFGIAALFLVVQRSPRALELYVACVLLIINGVGSILWHGLRTRWSLTLDWVPAVVFVLLVAVVWARRVGPWWQVAAVGGALLVAPLAVRFLDLGSRWPLRFGATAFVIVALALWLIVRSFAVSRRAGLLGAGALASAVAALTFRSIDAAACESLGMGTHFLWHMFLSGGAFLCLLTILTLDAEVRRGGESIQSPAPA